MNIEARCQVFLSFCPPAYKYFLQLSLLTTCIFLICSDVLLPPRWEVQGVSILFIYCFAHSATVESKKQDHETCLQQNRQLVCHKMWKYTTKVCSSNTYIQLKQIPLWSFLMAFFLLFHWYFQKLQNKHRHKQLLTESIQSTHLETLLGDLIR